MAHNTPPMDEMYSWNPAMRPDNNENPVATDSRDLTILKDDINETPILPSDSSAPARSIASREGGSVMKTGASGDIKEPAVSQDEAELNRALGIEAPPESNQSIEEPQPDRTTASIAEADQGEISQATAEELAKKDEKSFFNGSEQQNGVEENPFFQSARPEPSVEEAHAPEGSDTAGQHELHQNNQYFSTDDANDTAGNFWDNADDNADGEDDFFNQLKTQTKPIYMPPEPDIRYEEGVPLLNSAPETPVEPTAPTELASPPKESASTEKTETRIDSIFAGDEDESDDFFSQVQSTEPKRDFPGHLTRKSTSQVVDSFGEALDSPVSDASQNFNDMLVAPTSNQVNKSASEEDLAARWQAELSDNEEPEPLEASAPSADDLAARWQAELDDDDDGLLMGDEAEDTIAGQQQSFQQTAAPLTGVNGQGFGAQTSVGSSMASSIYTPHQRSMPDLPQGVPTQGSPQPIPPPAASYFAPQPPPKPAAPIRAESFAERSKQGYQSPYDVPDDLTRPRRPAKPVITAGPPAASNIPPAGNMQPPPRSSSIPAPPPAASSGPPPPMGMSRPTGAPPLPGAAPENFYEELPLPPPRPRSRPASSGRYTPNTNATVPAPPPAPAGFSQPPPPPPNPYANLAPSPLHSEPQAQPQMPPNPYASSLAPPSPAPPTASSRYSPKPPGLQAGPPPAASPRYSPAPPPAGPPRNNRYVAQPPTTPGQGITLPFQPRTSSPLVHHEKLSYQPEGLGRSDGPERRPSLEPAARLSPPNRFQPPSSLEQNQLPDSGDGISEAEGQQDMPLLANQRQMSPPRSMCAPPSYVNGFANRMAPVNGPPTSFPVIEMPDEGDSQFVPRRSQTQSPSQQMLGPKLSVPSADPFQRPASVHGSGSPTKTSAPYAPAQVSARARAPSQPLNFVPPTDGLEEDQLARWKGAPIVTFGFGGAVTSCFPKHIPRYSAGQPAPMIKSCPGEVKICQLNDWIPPADGIVAHPGPLKNKAKKKEVLPWLSSKIAAFENEGLPAGAELQPDSHKRHDEKILLWKIVRILVEKDGVLEGSGDVQKVLRDVIFPHLQHGDAGQTYGGGFQTLNAPAQPDAIDSRLIDVLRDNLILGEREKAVWGAVDNRLWGHAMIIAFTLDRSIWKQVVQEFVRREVRPASTNTESLAAVYEIFAGNVEESVDELVPYSARAGLQMINKVNGQESSKHTLDGLDSWRDTLGMVLSNRSPEDYQALLALGRLLLSYGRVEAAHICMIFSRAAVFGGADDPQASIVLLGADHQRFPFTFMHDEDAILLTEVYEFATSVLGNLPQASLPHLMGFKMLYAWTLEERGRKSEALQYCDAIVSALKSPTKPSRYFHQHLFVAVDELSTRLRQTTDGGSSFFSRPSMEKVSGSMWARFSSFVSGEDDDAASTGSGKQADADVGPFARVSGTPTVSRSPSMSDLYGSYPAAGQPVPGASRYHPSSQFASSSPEQFRGRSSMDSQRSSFGFSFPRRGSQEPATPTDNPYFPSASSYNSPMAGYQSTPPQTSYMPLAPVEEDLPSQPQPPPQPTSAPMQGSPYHLSIYTPEPYGQPFRDQGVNQPDSFGYAPPSTGYEPPVKEAPAPQEEEVEEERPKKAFMDVDEDDDLAARAAAVQQSEEERQDRETAEAFRKAAEEDAKKPPPPSKKSSWLGLGSLFGGSKKEQPDQSSSNPNKPIRAKLGEENSFYYDTELKKWVNKKDPNSATPTAAPPPPPKRMGPPSRADSTASVPMASAGTPPMASSAAGSRPQSSAGAPPSLSGSPAPPSTLGVAPSLPRFVSADAAAPTPPGSSAGLAPPPRPSTSLSNASSIDDLLGAPTARKGGTGGAKGRKKGRYVDVMAK